MRLLKIIEKFIKGLSGERLTEEFGKFFLYFLTMIIFLNKNKELLLKY